MTQQSKKEDERFFVERAAELLNRTWGLGPDRESPDFIVTEDGQQFGLEVCKIFTGRKSNKGSHMKEKEAKTQKTVDALKRIYEANTSIPLRVRLVGDMCKENMEAVVPALLAMGLSNKPYGHQYLIDLDEGPARLRVYVTRALSADWFSVNDRVGWVNTNPIHHIHKEIEKKSKRLPDYKACAGLDDIRLLIVANHFFRSGMLTLQEPPALNLRGFQFVYFFSYPESITVFDCTGNTPRSYYLCA